MTPDELRALAEALRRIVPHWVPVAERLPDADTAVLIHSVDASEPVWIGWTDGDYWRDTNGTPVRVTHWADMPAAPQTEPKREPCIGRDPACPCQDGDACHYRDAADGTKGWPVPQAEPKPTPASGDDLNVYKEMADNYRNDAQAEPKREPSDESITKGEYVLATKWSDGDPGDHWGVGFYDRLENGRHYIVDSSGKQIRGNGFRRVGRITAGVGRWLLSAAKSLEASPPGTINLWTMLTKRAHGIGGSDAAR